MIALAVSRRDRRVLAIGALAVAAILGGGRGWPALKRWEAARIEAAFDTRARLEAAQRNAAAVPFVRDSTAARARRLQALRSRLLAGATVEAAAASLGALVEGIARDEGVDVMTMTLRSDSVARLGLARVSVRISAEGDVRGLMDLLASIESNARMLAVRELAVAQPAPMAPSSRPEALRFDIAVEALARVGLFASSPGKTR